MLAACAKLKMARRIWRHNIAIIVDDPDLDSVDGLTIARCSFLFAVRQPADRRYAGFRHSPAWDQLSTEQLCCSPNKLGRNGRSAADETPEGGSIEFCLFRGVAGI